MTAVVDSGSGAFTHDLVNDDGPYPTEVEVTDRAGEDPATANPALRHGP